MRFCISILFLVGLFFLVLLGSPAKEENQEIIDFNTQIRPILSDRCYACHGPDGGEFGEKWRGGLRLDIEEGAKADLSMVKLKAKNARLKSEGKETISKKPQHQYAIVPGKLSESLLIERILTDDPDDVMPTVKSKMTLSSEEKELLKKWVAQGAKWGNHWSFEKPIKAKLPEVDNKKWPINEVDYFVLKNLEKNYVHPSPETDRISWLRRVSLDITGLPPTPAQVDAFLKDNAEDAYEKIVDALLATDAYAERMAIIWLDNARYADSNGFQYDKLRSMWPWREWVIKAFQKNMPFDKFVTEQIAGDLLPNATSEQILATGFNRNHGYTTEGGVIAEEYRVQYVNDRVNTFAAVFMGLTFDCTRCHDHKYDPLTQKDFYQLSSFFNNVTETGKGAGSAVLKHYAPQFRKDIEILQGKLKEVQKELDMPLSEKEQLEFDKWSTRKGDFFIPNFIKVSSKSGATVTKKKDGSWLFTGKNVKKDTYSFSMEVTEKKKFKTFVLEALLDSSMPGKGPGRSSKESTVLSSVAVTRISKKTKKKMKVVFSRVMADYSQEGFPVEGLLEKESNGWSVSSKHDKRMAVFETAKALILDVGDVVDIRLIFRSTSYPFGRVRLSFSENVLEDTFQQTLAQTEITDVNKKLLRHLFKGSVLQGGALKKKHDVIRKQIKVFEAKNVATVMVMNDKKPRKQHILIRGEYNKPGEEVSPNTPKILPEMREDLPKNRLGLAQWITDKENPLMSRVVVNRFWQIFFGMGLVKTTEDFGAQGEAPSHPQLLDWLSVEFMEQKWDVKKILKKIALSATYRQSSQVRKDVSDPENRLLSYGPRFRLDAEIIRDQALFVSGLLVDKVGGPSVFPYQPGGLWAELTNRPGSVTVYKEDTGEKLYRKSLYTVWRRASINPAMEAFDAPTRDVCVVKRSKTNTPLQALVLLHDPTFVEAARALAEKVMLEVKEKNSVDKQIISAFRWVLIRKPTTQEMAVLKKLYDDKIQLLTEKPQLIESQLKVGEYKHKEGLDRKQLAALTTICITLFNLSETITRN